MKKKPEFDFVTKVSLGQYIPIDSVIHKLDPRLKIIIVVLLIFTSIIVKSLASLILLLIFVIFTLFLTHVKARLAFAPLKSMVPILIVLALFQIFLIPGFRADANILWKWKLLIITDKGLKAAVLLILRFALILLGLSAFSFATSAIEFINGVEHLLRPLQKIGLPAHEFALVINISVRFIPILIMEAEKLMKAQASRGADFGTGRINLFKRIRKMLPLLIPLFIISLRHAQNLIEAMESRCYLGGKGRSHFIIYRMKLTDYFAFAISILIFISVFILNFIHIDGVIFNLITTNMSLKIL